MADLGDVAINPYSLPYSIARIERAYDAIVAAGCKPITLGGDHTITLPILRALHRRHGPIGLIHIDAHADVNDTMFGESIAHGIQRAVAAGAQSVGVRRAADFTWDRAVQAHVDLYKELAE